MLAKLQWPRFLDENAAAVDMRLSSELLERLNSAFPPDAAAGERYVPAMKAFVNG
ncbi:MAG TPA: hypothetical protein VGG18_02605 [Granulicella sp.]|jgi:hypothetical protein